MIVHLLLLKARSDLTGTEQEEFQQTVNGLAEVPGVDDLTWGPDISGRAKGYTHAASMRLQSREALQTYLDHPRHKHIVETLNRLAPDRLVVDYETG